MIKVTITQDQLDEERRDAEFQGWMEDVGFSHIFTHAKSGHSFYEDPDGNLWEWDQMVDSFKDSLTR
jgi:hypothetical protein